MSKQKVDIEFVAQYALTRQELINFRRSTYKQRAETLELSREVINDFKVPKTQRGAALNNQIMSNIATLIKYNQMLTRMENQEYFEVLIDWYELLPKQPQWAELSNYFEMSSTQKSLMRLKCPINQIPPKIWELFEQAQKTCGLRWFETDATPMSDEERLYPVMFQGLGRRVNTAGDLVAIPPDGLIEFSVDDETELRQLPGGGMHGAADPMDQQVDKFIKEQCADIHTEKAIQAQFDAIEAPDIEDAFKKILYTIGKDGKAKLKVDLVGDASKSNKPGYPELLQQLQNIIASKKANSVRISEMVAEVDAEIRKHPGKEGASHQHYLRTLRADIQLFPCQKLPLWAKAKALLANHSIHLEVDQLLDSRAAGNSMQASHIFLLNEHSFKSLFREEGVTQFTTGDDLTGQRFESFTYLALVKNYMSVKFHHLEIANTALQHSLIYNIVPLEKVFNQEEFEAAKKSLLSGLDQEQQLNEKAEILSECWELSNQLPKFKAIYEDARKDLLNPLCTANQFRSSLLVRKVLGSEQLNTHQLQLLNWQIRLRQALPNRALYNMAIQFYNNNSNCIYLQSGLLNINIPALVDRYIQFDASNPKVGEARQQFMTQIALTPMRELFQHLGQEVAYNKLLDAIQNKYLAQSKKILGTSDKKAKNFKGLQRVLDLNPVIALARELKEFAMPKSKDNANTTLKKDLKKALSKYSSSMFVAPHRKKEVSALKKRLKHLEKTAPGGQPTYMEVIQELHKQKLACMDDDIKINKKRHSNKLNRKGSSRLMKTLNKMEDLVVNQMIQTSDVNQIDLYKDFTRDQFKDLALAVRCTFEAQKDGEGKYTTVISQLKGIEDLTTPLTSDQVTHLMATLETKKLPGHINAMVKDLGKRSVALVQDLKEAEHLNAAGMGN